MPLYDYKCTQCGKVTEVRHGFNESHDDPCPACGGTVRRVFSAAPIVFKGSGYYITDSRKSGRLGSRKSRVRTGQSGSGSIRRFIAGTRGAQRTGCTCREKLRTGGLGLRSERRFRAVVFAFGRLPLPGR